MNKALLVIDLQNDYFPGGGYPLANTEVVLEQVVAAVTRAREAGVPIFLIQHLVSPDLGPAPFFNEGSEGARIHPAVLAAAPGAPVIVKRYADAFDETELAERLADLGTTEILVCGMMTQNCVTHTALSRSAEEYQVTVLPECCTTVDGMLHAIALNALSRRVQLAPASDCL